MREMRRRRRRRRERERERERDLESMSVCRVCPYLGVYAICMYVCMGVWAAA